MVDIYETLRYTPYFSKIRYTKDNVAGTITKEKLTLNTSEVIQSQHNETVELEPLSDAALFYYQLRSHAYPFFQTTELSDECSDYFDTKNEDQRWDYLMHGDMLDVLEVLCWDNFDATLRNGPLADTDSATNVKWKVNTEKMEEWLPKLAFEWVILRGMVVRREKEDEDLDVNKEAMAGFDESDTLKSIQIDTSRIQGTAYGNVLQHLQAEIQRMRSLFSNPGKRLAPIQPLPVYDGSPKTPVIQRESMVSNAGPDSSVSDFLEMSDTKLNAMAKRDLILYNTITWITTPRG